MANGKMKEVEMVTEEIVALRQAVERLERRILPAMPRARGTHHDIKPWFVGDDTDTDKLKIAVEGAIRANPLTLQELSEVTGARRNRISGVLVKLQKNGVPVENKGDRYRAIWSIPSQKRAR